MIGKIVFRSVGKWHSVFQSALPHWKMCAALWPSWFLVKHLVSFRFWCLLMSVFLWVVIFLGVGQISDFHLKPCSTWVLGSEGLDFTYTFCHSRSLQTLIKWRGLLSLGYYLGWRFRFSLCPLYRASQFSCLLDLYWLSSKKDFIAHSLGGGLASH